MGLTIRAIAAVLLFSTVAGSSNLKTRPSGKLLDLILKKHGVNEFWELDAHHIVDILKDPNESVYKKRQAIGPYTIAQPPGDYTHVFSAGAVNVRTPPALKAVEYHDLESLYFQTNLPNNVVSIDQFRANIDLLNRRAFEQAANRYADQCEAVKQLKPFRPPFAEVFWYGNKPVGIASHGDYEGKNAISLDKLKIAPTTVYVEAN